MLILSSFVGISGRLPRGRFWLAALLLVVFTVVVEMLLVLAGFGQTAQFTSVVTPAGGAAVTEHGVSYTLNPWGNLILILICLYPWLAIAIKRRHDRDSTGIDVLVIEGLFVLSQLLQALFGPQLIIGVIGLLTAIGGIYLLIVLGFLRGTSGTNRFGADSLFTGATGTP